jgi:hypothetical protein
LAINRRVPALFDQPVREDDRKRDLLEVTQHAIDVISEIDAKLDNVHPLFNG